MANPSSVTSESTQISLTQMLAELTRLQLQNRLNEIKPSWIKVLKSTTCPEIFSFLLESFAGSEVRVHQVCDSGDVVIEPRAATLIKVTRQAKDMLISYKVGECQMDQKVPYVDIRNLAAHGIQLDASYNPMFADFLGVPVPIYPALCKTVVTKADPAYVQFYRTKLENQPMYLDPVSLGESASVEVERMEDVDFEGFFVRIYFPKNPRAPGPSLCIIGIPGGGWSKNSPGRDKSFFSQLCQEHSIPVVSIGHRRTPQHRFPAAVEDVNRAVERVWSTDAKSMGLDVSKAVLVGISSSVSPECDFQVLILNSGGHLGTVAALTDSTTMNIEKVILVAAPLDNTHTASWKHDDEAGQSPGLTPKAMSAFQDAFLAPSVDRYGWRVSPIYADDDRLRRAKDCSWSIHVANLDFPGPHDILRLDLVLEGGRQIRRDISGEIRDSMK